MAGHPEGTIGWDTPIPEPMIYQSGVATGRSQPRPMPLPPCPPLASRRKAPSFRRACEYEAAIQAASPTVTSAAASGDRALRAITRSPWTGG